MKEYLLQNLMTLAQTNPLGNANDLNLPDTRADSGVVENIIEVLLFLAGGLSVIMVIVGGIMFITSAGNPDLAKRGRTTLTYAIIGLLVTVLAYAIVRLVVNVTQGESIR